MFADIVLPLPLDGLFTYSVPEGLADRAKERCRVLVPFGRNKTYVGIITELHDRRPEGYQVKDILQVIDSQPILLPLQFRLWQWIAEYYMSPIGEVYKAALPAGMKAEEGYKPRTETYIRLGRQFQNKRSLRIALDMLSRAGKQQKAFCEYLRLSEWDSCGEQDDVSFCPIQVSRDELLNAAGVSANIIGSLVKNGLLETYELETGRLNQGGEPHPENIKQLSASQLKAYNEILFSFLKKDVTLLHGVTSSGKTEIYIHLIQREIEQHRQVLYLLPEIALTVQMMDRLRRVFGGRLGIYHSKYSDAERVEIWQKQLSQHPYDIILGARSAVFLPFQHLGLVIVDEEHETSYKQQEPAPRYHARSVAIMLMKLSQTSPQLPTLLRGGVAKGQGGEKSLSPLVRGGAVLLGTATPSMESYRNAQTGKYGLVTLNHRHQDIQLPQIEVVDVQDLMRRRMMKGIFSPLLLARLREAIENGEQAILFQNRRGYSPVVECKQCGWVPHCKNCDVPLTLHRQMGQMTCHYCGTVYNIPTECPACGNTLFQTHGYGTEKIEVQLRDIFPEARIARMDLDTTRSRRAYERIISDFAAGNTNILIGTQMISKGLDFDHVSVVGILDADAMLNQPDFRAYEHAYTMMTQVSGRAGRRNKRGMVILQTRQSKLPVIQQLVQGDFASLYHDLCEERIQFRYPPFYRLIYVYLKHRSEQIVDTAALYLASMLRLSFSNRVLGPDKPPVAKVKSLAIRKIVLKLEYQLPLDHVRNYLRNAQQQMMADKRFPSIQIYHDIDPI